MKMIKNINERRIKTSVKKEEKRQNQRAARLKKSLPDMKGDFNLPDYAQIKIKDRKNIISYTIIGSIVICFFIFFSAFSLVKVSGHSMDPTLHDGQYFLGKKHEKPQRFDIVVLTEREKKSGPEKTIVKRVIGLPGDRVTVINGELFINNKHYREKYVVKKNKANYDKLNWTIKVPKNEIFVLGDNRDISKDSRIVGCFKQSAINAVKAF